MFDNDQKKQKIDVHPSGLELADFIPADQDQLSPSQVKLSTDIDGKISAGLEKMVDCQAQVSESQVQSKQKTKKKRLRK